MKRDEIQSVFFLALFLIATSGHANECSGRPNCYLPVGFVENAGWVVDIYNPSDYAISLACKGNEWKAFLQRRIGTSKDGKPKWVSIADLALPPLKADETYVYFDCRKDGDEPDPSLIVIAKKTDGPEYTNIIQAWRASIKRDSFEQVPISGILCENEGYGL
jgi:hypothetical protein